MTGSAHPAVPTRSLRAGTRPCGSKPNGRERLSGSPDVGMRLHLEVEVRQRRVAGVPYSGQRIAPADTVACPDLQRPAPQVRQHDEVAAVELDDDRIPRHVGGVRHEASALSVVHVVPSSDHRAVGGRRQLLLPAVDPRVALRIAEDPAVAQVKEVEREPLVVRREMKVLERAPPTLNNQPLALERRSEHRDCGRPTQEGASQIEDQHHGPRHHDPGWTVVGLSRGKERRRNPEHGNSGHAGDHRQHLLGTGKYRQAGGGSRRPEAGAADRLEQYRTLRALAKRARQSGVKAALPQPPAAAGGRPNQADHQHTHQRLMAVRPHEPEGEQRRDAKRRERRCGDRVRAPTHRETAPLLHRAVYRCA